MISYVESHPDEFEELIGLALLNKQPYSWRAAWLLSNCMDYNDQRIKKYIPKIINALTTVKDGQKRDLINVLRRMEINEEHEGLLFDICVAVWSKIDKLPSVRSSAFKLIIQITKKHPELFNEVVLLTQTEYIESLSHGIKRSIQKLVNSLNQE